MPRFVAVDIETSGLDPDWYDIIEVGLVVETDTGVDRIEFSLPFDLSSADDRALEINGYGQRAFAPRVDDVAKQVGLTYPLLDGVHIIGKNPSFDVGFLKPLFQNHGYMNPPWHHRLIDVGMLAWGWYNAFGEVTQTWQEYPPNSECVAELVGVPLPTTRHTALADAEWAYDVFRKIVPR